MKVLHLLASGSPGGIESLCKNIILNADFDNRLMFIFCGGSIYEELKEKNSNVILLKKKKYQLLRIIKEITDYCKKEKIDIINIHHGGVYCNLIYILLKKYNPNIKFVRFLHGCYDKYTYGNNGKKLNDWIVYRFMKKALEISDIIISVSNAVEKSFEKSFDLSNKNTVVIYNGIADNFFQKEIKHINNNEITNIIYVGRLAKVKGIDNLIKAVNKLISENYKLQLTIVGDGKERFNLEKLAIDLNINDYTKFVGAQSNVIDWLDKADIFVYPSIWEEAFGISVVEAMTRGCIPLVANKGGLPEVVEYNKMFLFDNQEELIEKMKEIILTKDNIDLEKIIKNAKRFRLQNTIDKLKKEYEFLCTGEKNEN